MDDATAKNLEPLIIVINLKFKWGLRKGKEITWPAHLNIAEHMACQAGKRLFQIVGSLGFGIVHIGNIKLVKIEYSYALHLVEDGVMRFVNCVFPVDITHTQETVAARLDDRDLVHWGVRA